MHLGGHAGHCTIHCVYFIGLTINGSACECRWAATLGIVLAISRGFIAEQGVAFEPELALLEVVAHTHWLPRHWRGRGHTREVQEQFQQLFQFKVRCPCLQWLAGLRPTCLHHARVARHNCAEFLDTT